MSKPDTPARWLRGVLTVLVGSLFALSFWENWAALTHAAVQGHIPHPGPWPWMVDGFILAMALMAVLASMERRSVWWPRTGMVGSTALSLAVVVSHAPAAHGGRWLAAWSPVAVLFSFECLMWLVFGARRTVVHAPGQAVQGHAPATRARVPEDFPEPVVPLGSEPDPAPDTAPDTRPAAPVQPRRHRALTPDETRRVTPLAAQGLKAYTIARQTGIREPVVRQHLRDHTPASTNGSRP